MYAKVTSFTSFKKARKAAQERNVPFVRIGRLYVVPTLRRTHANVYLPSGRIVKQIQLARGRVQGKNEPAYQW